MEHGANLVEPSESDKDTLIGLTNDISNRRVSGRGPVNRAYLRNLITDRDYRDLADLSDIFRDPAKSRWFDYVKEVFYSRFRDSSEPNGVNSEAMRLFPAYLLGLNGAVRDEDLKGGQVYDLANKMLDDMGKMVPDAAKSTPAEASPGDDESLGAGAAPAAVPGSPDAETKSPSTGDTNTHDDVKAASNPTGSKEDNDFHLDRGWDKAAPWYAPEKAAEIHYKSRDAFLEDVAKSHPEYVAKSNDSLEEIKNGKPVNPNGEPFNVYDNPFDAAMAAGYYMRSKTSSEDEEWGTLVYPWDKDGRQGFVFVEAKKGDKETSNPLESREYWDKIDVNTRDNEAIRSHTHGLRNTIEGSMHFSPEDYNNVKKGKIEHMVNSRGEHRFFFPGSGDNHVYVIDRL